MVDKKTFVENVQDLRSRIQESCILYNGVPHYVRTVISMNQLEILPADQLFLSGRQQNPKLVNLDDDLLDVNPFRLGYVNTKWGAYFLARRPYRGVKLGLQPHMLVVKEDTSSMIDRAHLVYCKGLVDMVAGVYPTHEEAIKKIQMMGSEINSVAVSRVVALKSGPQNTIRVFHRGEEVGVTSVGSAYKRVRLHNPKSALYLTSDFHKVGLEIVL